MGSLGTQSDAINADLQERAIKMFEDIEQLKIKLEELEEIKKKVEVIEDMKNEVHIIHEKQSRPNFLRRLFKRAS